MGTWQLHNPLLSQASSIAGSTAKATTRKGADGGAGGHGVKWGSAATTGRTGDRGLRKPRSQKVNNMCAPTVPPLLTPFRFSVQRAGSTPVITDLFSKNQEFGGEGL